MEQEIWKDVLGYQGLYKVSNLGNIYSTITNKQLKPIMTSLGYTKVWLYENKESKMFSIHRLVAIAFIDNVENKKDVNHINGIKHDNRLCNLEWVTNSENQKHAFKIGLRKIRKGKDNPMFGKKGILHNSYGVSRFVGKDNPMYGKPNKMKGKLNLKHPSSSILLNTQTGIYYESIKEASIILGYNYTTLKSRLKGRLKNNTNLIYV